MSLVAKKSPKESSAHPFEVQGPLRRLPLVTLYVTERCNSRCVTCDYWRHGRGDMRLESVARLLPDLAKLGTQIVLLSGGEPLLNPEWAQIGELLRSKGLKVWLLTSGLSLAKHARRAAALFDAITVSLDGTNGKTYAAIRGLDAFDRVCEGVRTAVAAGRPPSLRVTLQRANYRELPAFVDLARAIGARQVSFLAVDVANSHAFGRAGASHLDLAPSPQDLPEFEQCLNSLERDHAADFRSGFIAETPQKLRRILQYFAALHGEAAYPTVHCNAPEFSAVLDAAGRVHPCFFIAGPPDARVLGTGGESEGNFSNALNVDGMAALRAAVSSGGRAECKTCVCSMWRDPDTIDSAALLM